MKDKLKEPAAARILMPEIHALRPRGWFELSGISHMSWLVALLAMADVTDWGVL
jgi:hypothetical protein